MPVNGQDVKFNYYTRAKFNALSSKDNNTIYYVEETNNAISMYIGNREIGTGIDVVKLSGDQIINGTKRFNDLRLKGSTGLNFMNADLSTILGGIRTNLGKMEIAGDYVKTGEIAVMSDLDSIGGIDLNTLGYMNHASKIFYDSGKQNQFKVVWENHWTNSYGNESSGNNGVIIPYGTTAIGDDGKFNEWRTNNQPLVIPNSVTSLGYNAFNNWNANNQPLVIPNSITTIGERAFRNWSVSNQPLVIPNSVTSIGSYAFSSWLANTHPLVIPDSVTSIAASAFYGWLQVPYVEMKRTTPPTLSRSNAFNFEQNNAPIYVPHSAVTAYKSATNWSALASRIFSINER